MAVMRDIDFDTRNRIVIPAKAGIQSQCAIFGASPLDSRSLLRSVGNDSVAQNTSVAIQ